MRLGEEEAGRAAGSARVGMVGADQGWDGKEAWHTGRWVERPSCQAAGVGRWDPADPWWHEDRDEPWEKVKVGDDDAWVRQDDLDRRGKDRKDLVGSLDRSGKGLAVDDAAWVDDRSDRDG